MSATLDEVAATVNDDPKTAFRTLRDLMAFPAKVESKEEWSRAFGLFLEIGAAMGDESELAASLKRGVEDPDDTKALFDIGFQLIELQLYGISASVLGRANDLAPGVPSILNELVYALEQGMLNQEACRLLRARPELTAEATVSRYLLAFHCVMTGDLDGARELYPALLASDDESLVHMGGTICGMVGRADAIAAVSPLDHADLRGWHYVLNAAMLLHLSPHGLDEPMRGRYAWVQDSLATIQEGIRRLVIGLQGLGQAPERVFALPERGSQIVAYAAAAILELPVVEWTADTELPGLIAVYDLEHLDGETLVSVADHRPGQILWAHAACWTHDPPFCPDLVTMLYQHNAAPWAERLSANPDGGEGETVAASTASVEELAKQVLAAVLEDEQLADLETLRGLAAQMMNAEHDVGPAALRSEGRRGRQWLGSPVASARFA